VELISWYDALVFCNRLSELHGLTPVYRIGGSANTTLWGAVPTADNPTWNAVTIVATANGYRLPTQAQWEHAYRAGNSGTFYFGSTWDNNFGWTSENANNYTHQVGLKIANRNNLYDMAGNVLEWTWDNVSGGNNRYLRGGRYNNSSGAATATYQEQLNPQNRLNYAGLRVVRPTSDIPPPDNRVPPVTTPEMVFIPYGGLIDNTRYGDFYIGKYEITQSEWQTVMGNPAQNNISAIPSQFTSNADTGEDQARRPVERVSWYAAIVFCNRLSVRDNLTPAYAYNGNTNTANWGNVPNNQANHTTWFNPAYFTIVPGATGYRLPTRVHWEYAYRAGTTTNYYWGSQTDGTTVGSYSWYSGNSNNKTHEVGKKMPNAYGLYDMAGNVAEWLYEQGVYASYNYNYDSMYTRGSTIADDVWPYNWDRGSVNGGNQSYGERKWATNNQYLGLRVMLPVIPTP
jgi:formylglycine-generating enzyme required for sulfatase activity